MTADVGSLWHYYRSVFMTADVYLCTASHLFPSTSEEGNIGNKGLSMIVTLHVRSVCNTLTWNIFIIFFFNFTHILSMML